MGEPPENLCRAVWRHMAGRLGQPGTPGCPPWPPAAARDTLGTPGRCSLRLGWWVRKRVCSQPRSSGADHRVVLAKPFVPPEDSSLGCAGSPRPAQGLLLSPCAVLCGNGGGWRDVGHTAMQFLISGKLWGEEGTTPGGFQASLGHLAATATSTRDIDTPGMSVSICR